MVLLRWLIFAGLVLTGWLPAFEERQPGGPFREIASNRIGAAGRNSWSALEGPALEGPALESPARQAPAPADDPEAGTARGSLGTGVDGPAREEVLFARLEEVALVLLAVFGTVAIVWVCLTLDQLTRHHFSRRLQALALLLWVALGAVTTWLLARLLTGD